MRVRHMTRGRTRVDGHLPCRERNIFHSGRTSAYDLEGGEIPSAARAIAIPKKNRPEALPLEEQIRQRAFEIYLQRGGQDGSENQAAAGPGWQAAAWWRGP
jgi:hypothetical protein